MQPSYNRALYNQFVAAVKQNPHNADAWEQLGDFLADSGDAQHAKQCYRRVLALRPDDLEVQVNLEHIEKNTQENSLLAELEDLLQIDNLRNFQLPFYLQVLLAILSFLLTLILADAQHWQATDLVWSLWISSLTLGYAFLITSIIGNIIQTGCGEDESTTTKVMEVLNAPKALRWLGAIAGGIFMLGFFSIHFGMFHFVHSVFLNMFFPLTANQEDPFKNIFLFIQIGLLNYWPVILFSAITQISAFQKNLLTPSQNSLMTPYKNVLKMHITIFVIAGLNSAGLQNWMLLYLLIFYFFPFGSLLDFINTHKKNAQETH